MPRPAPACLLLLLAACVRTGTVGVIEGETETGAGTLTGDDDGDDDGDDGTLLDLPGTFDACNERLDGMMGVGNCMQAAPADSFEPTIQWTWPGRDGDTDTRVIALVANVTDDDDDGDVDLCDIPDIIVTAGPPPPSNPMTTTPPEAHLYALDGASGTEHWRSAEGVRAAVTPAIADIDGDGLVEIVTLQADGDPTGLLHPSRLVAFAADGSLKWKSGTTFEAPQSAGVAIADLDLDLDAEIMVANQVFDHEGRPVFAPDDVGHELGLPLMPTAVDLDDDGDLEVLWSRAAYHHDGTALWRNLEIRPGFVHVANLDGQPGPEILITTDTGMVLLQPDGSPLGVRIKPIDAPDSNDTWRRPAAIHNIDDDRDPEILLSVGVAFLALSLDNSSNGLDIAFQFPVQDSGGSAAGTAFDFLGDASAEAMYADEQELFVFDTARGGPAFTAARSSVTLEEYPVVADVDNDGSAEIVVGSNATTQAADPTIRVIGDAGNRWVQARRIWNQHTYHVSNIREDGQLPSPEPHHWERTNTFRTNAQIEAGAICLPEP